MNVMVKFLSQFRVMAGTDKAEVELPEKAKVAALLDALREPYPGIFPVVEQHAMIMVNHKMVAPETVLQDGDEVMLLQILGGG
jgi:molybdopterin converting factor small subunit